MKLKPNHPWKRRQRIRANVRILKIIYKRYGTIVALQNLRAGELDLKLAVLDRWK